ncbi:MAG: RagB/SusD family nutrient uptake outer membrane protein [Flavobacteriaceae bacterium]
MKYTAIHKKITKLALVIMVLIFSFSCEDYLEESLTTEVNQEFLYKTTDGLKAGVKALYVINRDSYIKREFWWGESYEALVLVARADISVPMNGTLSNFGKYSAAVSATNYTLSHHWKKFNAIANKATSIIVAAEAMVDITESDRKQIISEAKFFRANSYFVLYRIYNNIYVTEEAITPENAFDLVLDKSSEEDIFDLLSRDLDYGIENLNWTDQFGRVTKGAAKHLRAKVAMWEGDWPEAKLQAETLISDGPHDLVNVADVFDDKMNHDEQLFTLQYENDVNGGGNRNMVNWNLITQYNKLPGMIRSEEYGGKGASFLLPNNYLLGLLSEDPNDARDDNNYFVTEYRYNDAANVPAGFNVGDIVPNPYAVTSSLYYKRLHPSCKKYSEEGTEPDNTTKKSNFMVYRLAETYLIAAEANMRMVAGTGLFYLNKVRERAGAADATVINETAILDERARELSFEGQRWFTLKRMGINVLRHQIQTYAGDDGYKDDARTNFQDHYINFPIPQSQLDFLGPNYPQNTGF